MKDKAKNIIIGLFFLMFFSVVSSIIESIFLLPNFNETATQTRLDSNILWYLVPLIVAPVIEEWLFRGVLLSKLNKMFPFKYSNVICAFIFSLFHLEIYLLPYFLNGLIYGWIKTKNNSLYSAIILHILYNLIAVFISM